MHRDIPRLEPGSHISLLQKGIIEVTSRNLSERTQVRTDLLIGPDCARNFLDLAAFLALYEGLRIRQKFSSLRERPLTVEVVVPECNWCHNNLAYEDGKLVCKSC